MKKLRVKVFVTIFVILSLFVLIMLGINNYRNYESEVKLLESALKKIPNSLGVKEHNFFGDFNKDNKMFLDFTVYTVILDKKGNYKELINHSNSDILDENVINDIIVNHKSNLYVGNLYKDKYSYFFSGNMLNIIDNTVSHNKVLDNLYITMFLFIILEVCVFVVAYFLTNWIIKPVIESFKRQEEFIHDASHELKTPISVILASVDAYYLKKEDKWVDNIKFEANKMTKLVTEMLDLAKLENNKDVYLSCNISKVIEKCILTFEAMLFEKDIKLDYDIEDDIYMMCFSEQIERLINILLDNAICHSVENGKICISLKVINKDIVLEVKNKGLPIKKGDEKKIFERFYRGDESRNRDSNRYGLGLSIAKNIVINHNGKIEAFSKDGYTTFRVCFIKE